MVIPNRNYELKYHNCSLKFILNISVIENLLNAKNNLYLMYLLFRPMYSALASNLPIPTTPLLGSKQSKLKETWRTLHIEELLTFYSTS
jgi:predicted DNA-binding helix-hairpin-helix protein